MKTYTIEASRLAAAHTAIAKSNKIAAKLGVAPATIEVLRTWDVPERYPWDHPLNGCETGRVVHMAEFAVEGTTPKFNGWTLRAVLTPGGIEGQNLVKAVPGDDKAEGWATFLRTWDIANCQHCNAIRQRKDAFALESINGEVKVVGRQCLKNFLGHPDPETLWAFFGELAKVEGEMDEWGRSGAVAPEWTMAGWLAWVAKAIREDGWVSAAAARDTGRETTNSNAWNLIDAYYRPRRDTKRPELPTEQDAERAQAAVKWALEEMNPKGDYMWNLKQAVSREYLETRESGIVASLLPTWERELSYRAERAAKVARKNEETPSEWQGEVGKRGAWALTVVGMRTFQNDFGTTTKVNMVDETGNDFVWWASNGGAGLEIGETATVVGTVKQHGEFNGRKFTNLTRCAIQHIPSAVK